MGSFQCVISYNTVGMHLRCKGSFYLRCFGKHKNAMLLLANIQIELCDVLVEVVCLWSFFFAPRHFYSYNRTSFIMITINKRSRFRLLHYNECK